MKCSRSECVPVTVMVEHDRCGEFLDGSRLSKPTLGERCCGHLFAFVVWNLIRQIKVTEEGNDFQ